MLQASEPFRHEHIDEVSFRPGKAKRLEFFKVPEHVIICQRTRVRQGGVKYVHMREVWEQAEQIYEGGEVAETTVDDEVPCRASKAAKRGLELGLSIAEFEEVDFENAKGFNESEVGESFEDVSILCFIRGRVTQPPYVRRKNFSSFFRNILAPPPEPRLLVKPDVAK